MSYGHAACWLLQLLLLWTGVQSKRVTGVVSSKEGFKYLTKFCFDSTPDGNTEPGGYLKVNLYADKAQSKDIQLLIYDDQPESWPSIYGKKDVPCYQKKKAAKNAHWGVPYLYRAIWRNGRWELPHLPIWEHARPRFWYVVVANCKGFEQLGFDVTFHNRGSAWNTHFGVNLQHLNTLYVIAFAYYTLLVLAQVYGVHEYYYRHAAVHPVVKLLSIGLVLHFAGVFANAIRLLMTTYNGFEHELIALVGELSEGMARLVFSLLLLLLGDGWTISSDNIHNRSVIFGGLVAAFAVFVVLVVWDAAYRDPASTVYAYDSVPGSIIVCLDLFLGLWFHMSIFRSYHKEESAEKRHFYRVLWLAFGMWFLFLPLLVAFASAFLDPWNREFYVRTISMCVSTAAYTFMAYLLWPSRAEEYFAISLPDVSNALYDYRDL